MKIKEIKLYGFKSFPEETKIILNTGITAFVGPNGSGKSNIFDALRWVFGEQSMKALRCERIEDLIYISPDTKNDAHFTEVCLTIDNEDYFPQFGGQFEIKRRFFRSGESEFFLNRVKCRLQDIQALFLNSGTLTYSFLELSEIEKIIHGDTKEMFDDVSGIFKYQERREQTKRRLESTEQDLLRLEDIIHEMQRSLRSLRRQVRQTKLYRELKDEYKMLTLFILKNDYNQAIDELSKIQGQIDNSEQLRQSTLQKIKQLEDEREGLKSEMEEIEAKKKDTFIQVNDINGAIEELQRRINEKEEVAKQIILSNERTITSIKEKEEVLNNSKNRLVEYECKKIELSDKIEKIRRSMQDEQTVIDNRQQTYFSIINKVKEIDECLKKCASEIQGFQQKITRLRLEKENKATILSRINEEHNKQKEEIQNSRLNKKRFEENLNTIISQQEELSNKLDEDNKKYGEYEANLAELEHDLKSRQETMTDCRLVIDTFTRRLKETGGAKEIEKIFDQRHRGLVRDNIKVAPGYESVVDICLLDILNFYIIDKYENNDFERLPGGRFGFVNTQSATKGNINSELSEGLSPVTKFVKFESSLDVLYKYINKYFLTENITEADKLSKKYPEYGFVTKDGILFKNGLIIIEKGEVGYFRIQQSLDDYKKKFETLKNEILFINEENKRLLAEMSQTKKEIEETRNQLFTVNVKKSECSLTLNELTQRIERMTKEYDNIKNDRDGVVGEIESLSTQIGELKSQIQDVKTKSDELKNEEDTLIDNSKVIEREIEKKNSLLNERKMELVALEERERSISISCEQIKGEMENVEMEINSLKQHNTVKNLEEIHAQINELNEAMLVQKRHKSELEALLPEKVLEEHTQKLNNIFDRLAEHQKSHEAIQNNLMQVKYESFQLSHKKDEMFKKAQEEFKIDLQDYVPDEEILGPENRLAEAKGKLEKLGEVNPLSLELYENEKKRLDEFLDQRDDIIAAKKNLLDSIEELDTRARDRFVNIFVQVKKEFNFVFSNFFEGGEADLVLSDTTNPLTSKVDIVVRMKGKRLKTINQLSGGERTLLAISLLLAFYLVKPAPFCILDEIDAPLDDANVVRFNKFLRDLSQRTQVVIITHNRATMEYADYLYGLTMEEPGQSKIISAKLADLEKIDFDA